MVVLKKGVILSYYVFTCPMPWNFLTKSEKYCAFWLSAYELQWEDGMMNIIAKCLITMAIIDVEESDDNKALYTLKDMRNANG